MEQDQRCYGRWDGPEKRGLVVDAEDEAEARESALGGEGDGPVDVVVQASGEVDDEKFGGKRGGCSGEDVELRLD